MKKKVKKCEKKLKWITLLSIFGVIILVSALSFTIYQSLRPVYAIESRVEDVLKEKKKREESVEGWIRVQGTNIDFPIIHDEADLNLGALLYDFAWITADEKKLGNKETIMGHNILNVSKHPLVAHKNHHRFEQLVSFMYYDFAKKNQYVQYTVDGVDHLYKIFAVGFVDDKKLDASTRTVSKNELKKHIKLAKKESFYDYSVDVDEDDRILTLVTCTRFFGSNSDIVFRVDAREVRENEKILKYRVAESAKYDKIKEEMEGEEEYEEA